jgi:hypothetical protein
MMSTKRSFQGRPASDFKGKNNSFHAGKVACGIVVATGAHMKKGVNLQKYKPHKDQSKRTATGNIMNMP